MLLFFSDLFPFHAHLELGGADGTSIMSRGKSYIVLQAREIQSQCESPSLSRTKNKVSSDWLF